MPDTPDGAPFRRVAIACQGGASHTAFTAGALQQICADYASQWAAPAGAPDQYRIIGLSGTSGGSICAFLAWYGLITGGPLEAARLLEAFWGKGIAAQTPLEDLVLQEGGLRLLRSPLGPALQHLAELLGAPYLFDPQLVMDSWAVWHIGPLADLIAPRPEHVNVEKLFASRDPQGLPLVDRERVAQIGEIQRRLQQISKTLSEIHGRPSQPDRISLRLDLIKTLARQVLQQIDAALIAPAYLATIRSQLHAILGWHADDPDLLAGRRKLVQPLPVLLLGAVDVRSGAFKAFDSRKGEISLQAVLASTILPELFKARAIGNQDYWDGLYSQNPPLRGFVELPDDPDEKPDEIWLIKIDPQEQLEVPDRPAEIADRRNELAGDLSLNQELSAIAAMNRWLGKLNAASRAKYKHIAILRMQLDETAVQRRVGGALDVPSKMYRGRGFVLGLMAHGGDQARAFLPLARQKARLRRLIDAGWNGLMDGSVADVGAVAAFAPDHRLTAYAGTPGGAAVPGPAGVQQLIQELQAACLAQLAPASPGAHCTVTIEDLIVEAQDAAAHEFLAACRWTLRGVEPDPAQGPAPGASRRPRSAKIQGTWVSRIVADQLVESWVWDTRHIQPRPRPIAPPDQKGVALRLRARAVVEHWLAHGWRAGDLSLVDACFATDYIHNDSGCFPEIGGRADYKAWLQGCAPRPDLTITRLFVDGDRVVAVLGWGGTQSGVVIFRVAGGAILESWWTWDTQRLLS